MPTLSIKNVPEHIVKRLRERAATNHRSLQGELMALVSEAAELAPESGLARRREVNAERRGTKTIEEIAAEHRVRWPEPFGEGPRAVDLIRADRDAR